MAPQLRVAVVGLGYFSRFHCEAWARMADVALVAVCDRDAAKAERAASAYGVGHWFADAEEMLDRTRPDLVDVVSPPATHRMFIEAAARRRIAVVCQKPFCRSLSEAVDAVEIAEAAGIALIVHENFRFQPWYAEVRRWLDERALGDVYQLTFRLRPGDGQGPGAYLDRQPYFQTMDRFLVHETAVHWIDTFRYLLGEPSGVYADLRRLNPAIAGEDAGIIVFDYTSGTRAVFDGNRLVDHPAADRRLTMGELLVEGSLGTLALDGFGRIHRRRISSNETEAVSFAWENRGFGGDCVFRLQRHVADHLLARRSPANTGRDYLAVMRTERAIYESSVQRRRVAL